MPNPLHPQPHDTDDESHVLCALNAVTADAAMEPRPVASKLDADLKPAQNATEATLANPEELQIGAPLVASGLVDLLPQDASIPEEQSPRSGLVRLYLYPNDLPPVGEEDELPLVGSSAITPLGQFSIISEFTPRLREEATKDEGYLRFLLQVAVGSYRDSLFIERRAGLIDGQFVFLDEDMEIPEPIHFLIGEEQPSVQEVDVMGTLNHYSCPRRRLADRTDVPVAVGEIHVGSNMTAKGTYGKASSISTRVSVGVRPWEGLTYTHGGMKTVTKGAENTKYYGTSYNQFLEAGFTFAKVKIGGACAHEVIAEPKEWDGSFESGTFADYPTAERCRKSMGAYATVEKGEFFKNRDEARLNENAIVTLGSGLYSEQHYGQHFSIRWFLNIGNPPWVLCGSDNQPPSKAEVVYAGS